MLLLIISIAVYYGRGKEYFWKSSILHREYGAQGRGRKSFHIDMGRIVFISIFAICKNESFLVDSRRILLLAVFSRVEDPVPRTYFFVAVVFVEHYNLFFPNQGVVVDAIMNFLST